MAWVQPDRHPFYNAELERYYARDEREQDRSESLAHAASRQPTTAAPSGPPQTPSPSSSGASEGPGTTLRDRAAYVADWLDECDGGPLRQRLLALMAELRFEQRLDTYAEGTK
jgi:hypothetical protein